MVKGISSYAKEYIKSFYKERLIINNTRYKQLNEYKISNQELLNSKNNRNYNDNSETLNLIIDANSYYYSIAEKLNWFIYDNFKTLYEFQNKLHLLLSIDNIGKIIFVFSGVDSISIQEAKILKEKGRMESVQKFYDSIIQKQEFLSSNSGFIPSPLNLMNYIQFIKDSAQYFKDNIEIKFSLVDNDIIINQLAEKYNGYIISNDSDFYIYKTPGFIDTKTIYYTKDNNGNPVIDYKRSTNDEIKKHFQLPHRELLPIFATLCGNISFDVRAFENFNNFIKNYRSKYWKDTYSIKNIYFRQIVSFLKDIYELSSEKRYNHNDMIDFKSKSTVNVYEIKELTLLQKHIIQEIFNIKPNENDPEKEKELEEILINTIIAYNPLSCNGDINNINDNNNTINHYKKNSFNIKFLMLNEKLLQENYYTDSTFPTNKDIEKEFSSYTSNDQLIEYFHLSKDTLPIFATLCGNDYLNIENDYHVSFHHHFYSVIKNSNYRDDTISIKYDIFRDLVNFILNINDEFMNDNDTTLLTPPDFEFDELTQLQQKIVKKIVKNIFNDHLEKFYYSLKCKFRNNLINSIQKYNHDFYSHSTLDDGSQKIHSKSDDDSNQDITSCESVIEKYESKIIIDRNDDLINKRIKFIDKDIFENYYLGNFNISLLKFLATGSYQCNQYLEDVDKENCWNISSDLRENMYINMLNIDINYKKIINQNSENQNQNENNLYIIKEFKRRNKEFIKEEIKINEETIDSLSLNTPEERFTHYLISFNSHLDCVKSLHYYLIPLVTSLRYLITIKSKENLFIYDKEDKFYYNFSNQSLMKENSIKSTEENIKDYPSTIKTNLYSYELEALLASSLAALSLVYLSYENIIDNKNGNKLNTHDHPYSSNEQKYNNLYEVLKYNKINKSLKLKNSWSKENIIDIEQFKNNIQIFSEFTNLLIVNSSMLQVLKILIDQPKFIPFYSMYQYHWEEVFHCLVKPIKNSKSKSISAIFKELFIINNGNKESLIDDYINYMDELYLKLLKIIISKP